MLLKAYPETVLKCKAMQGRAGAARIPNCEYIQTFYSFPILTTLLVSPHFLVFGNTTGRQRRRGQGAGGGGGQRPFIQLPWREFCRVCRICRIDQNISSILALY